MKKISFLKKFFLIVLSGFFVVILVSAFSFPPVEASDSDSVALTAVISSWASMSLSSTTMAFLPALVDSGGNTYIGVATTTFTAGTNNSGGLTISIKGANGSGDAPTELSGAGTNIVATTTTVVAGTDGYGAQCVTISGVTCAAAYDKSSDNVTVIPGGTQTAATYATATTGSGKTGTITFKAASVVSRTAGSYTDTITLTAIPGI